jgi:hypothetical protein
MIDQVMHLANQNPADAVESLKQTASSASRIAGHALGMTSDEIQTVTTRGIPAPVVAVVFFSVGALIAMRYSPESWITRVRRFGR